jgi:hypothetical protein
MDDIRRVTTSRGVAPEARRLYDQGWSLAKVGDLFGVDPGTVGYVFQGRHPSTEYARSVDHRILSSCVAWACSSTMATSA